MCAIIHGEGRICEYVSANFVECRRVINFPSRALCVLQRNQCPIALSPAMGATKIPIRPISVSFDPSVAFAYNALSFSL